MYDALPETFTLRQAIVEAQTVGITASQTLDHLWHLLLEERLLMADGTLCKVDNPADD